MPKKDEIIFMMGPYQGETAKEYVTRDSTVADGISGKHLYVRTDAVLKDGTVVFEWRGPDSGDD